MSGPSEVKRSDPKCPVCGKPMAAGARFCSKRCADIDLGRWLKGGYAIPGGPAEGPQKPPANDGEAPDET